ncbi:MAG: tRNA dihydrouridine synthase DusB [Ruminococcaceae bacterium]|nr:tRNA dihydrouridine synthase DusB [Oscillospiraceae bacterium]
MRIGAIEINPGAALAPMAGISDSAMRAVCLRQGAAFTVSEMVSAKALTMNDRKSLALLRWPADATRPAGPYGVQLFGHEPDVLAEAIHRLDGEDFDFLDLNMGCPAPKIVSHGDGAGLLREPAKAEAFARAAVAASRRPVTAKLRLGWDDATMTGTEVARRCEAAGVQLLAVHARTRAQQYTPGVNFEAVAAIKRAVGIPVLFNGDIASADDALYALRQTGCDGVMVGRAAVGDPFLFAQIRAALAGETPPPPPTLRRRLAVMEQQVRAMCDEKGEGRAMREARKVAAGYMRGLHGAAALRKAAHALTYYTDLADLMALAQRYNS